MRAKSHSAVEPSSVSLAASIGALITEKTTPFAPTRPVIPALSDQELNNEALVEVSSDVVVGDVSVVDVATVDVETVDEGPAETSAATQADAFEQDLEDDESYIAEDAVSPFGAATETAEAETDEPEATANPFAGELDPTLVPAHLMSFDPNAALRVDALDVVVDNNNTDTDFINDLTAGIQESVEQAQSVKKKPRRPWARQHQPAHVEPITTPPIIEQLAEYSEAEFGDGISDLVVAPPALVAEVDPDLEGFDPSRYFGLGAVAATEPAPGPELTDVHGLPDLAPSPVVEPAPAVPDFTELAEQPEEPVRDSRAVMQMLRELAALRHE